jgi:hypothetical protein
MKPSLVFRIALAPLLFSACVVSGQSYAQKTYRCGNTYQSVPCTGAEGKSGAVKTTDSGASQKPLAAADAKGKPGLAVPAVSCLPLQAVPAAAAVSAQPAAEDKKLAAAKQAEAEADNKKAAAAAEKKSKCEKIRNDLNYNTAQLRAGGSNVTQDRLNGERRQLNDLFTKESCQS